MGDSGSLTLGFLLAATSVHSSIKAPAAVAILVPILALGLPVIDTLLVMLVRFLERPKGRIGRPLPAHVPRRPPAPPPPALGLRRTGRRSSAGSTPWSSSSALALVVALTRNATLGVIVLAIEFAVLGAVRWLGKRSRLRQLRRRGPSTRCTIGGETTRNKGALLRRSG